jgi:hypothetical protein
MPRRRAALRQLPRAELLALAEEAHAYLEEAAPLRWAHARERPRAHAPPWSLVEHVLLADYVRDQFSREARASA